MCKVQLESNEKICEAYDCDEIATVTIEVSAGEFGIVELKVCEDCVSKFGVTLS
jgi:hypothetical protein